MGVKYFDWRNSVHLNFILSEFTITMYTLPTLT